MSVDLVAEERDRWKQRWADTVDDAEDQRARVHRLELQLSEAGGRNIDLRNRLAKFERVAERHAREGKGPCVCQLCRIVGGADF